MASTRTPPGALLQTAFDRWLAHQRVAGRLRRASSEAVYGAMWQALVAWCATRQPTPALADLQATLLQAYIASRAGRIDADGVLTPRYQQRLLALVQRVQAHEAWRRQQARATPAQALALADGTATGSAAAMLQPGRRRQSLLHATRPDGMPEPPLHLQPAQVAQLQALLTQADGDSTARWQQLRDRCAVALQLGAGLCPGEVRALRLADVQPAAPSAAATSPANHPARLQLQVAADGNAPAHAAPLADWAAAVLRRWLAVRQAEALGGDWLLPSTRSGKPWGKVAQYEAARRVLADAGLDPDGGGSFRLRHSFALRQLQAGHDEATVAAWLGVADPLVMARYRQVAPVLPRAASAAGAASAAAGDAMQADKPAWPV